METTDSGAGDQAARSGKRKNCCLETEKGIEKLDRKKISRWTALCTAGVLAFCAAGTEFAATSEEVEEEKEELEGSLEEAQALIDDLEANKEDTEDAIAELDGEMTEISAQLEELETDLEEKEEEIADTEVQLAEAEEDADEQYEDMKTRIKYLYETCGSMNYLTSLLSCETFADFVNQAEYITMINEYDREMLDEYEATVEYIETAKEELEEDQEELAQMEAEAEEEQEAVDLLLEEKEEQLASITGDLSEAEAEEAELESEMDALDEIAAQIAAAEAAAAEAEAAEEEAAESSSDESSSESSSSESSSSSSSTSSSSSSSSSSSNISTSSAYTGGTFTWPCPSSTTVSSDFGYRTSPTAGASTYHQGIDIAASYGASIVAAADGVVTVATYSSSAGNYVIISHGGGLYTVYMHCSSLAVSVGDSVSRGQTIAYVGSTGTSTGNHLHFGVQLNGTYVSPWNYL